MDTEGQSNGADLHQVHITAYIRFLEQILIELRFAEQQLHHKHYRIDITSLVVKEQARIHQDYLQFYDPLKTAGYKTETCNRQLSRV